MDMSFKNLFSDEIMSALFNMLKFADIYPTRTGVSLAGRSKVV